MIHRMKTSTLILAALATISSAVCGVAPTAVAQSASNDRDVLKKKAELKGRFGEQQFRPEGGFILVVGQKLPDLKWEFPELVATVVNRSAIPTRWFNERFEEVEVAAKSGRYYAYGEAPTPNGPPLRRAMTCCCLPGDVNLEQLAADYKWHAGPEFRQGDQRSRTEVLVDWWRTTEEGAVELAALIEAEDVTDAVRLGQRQMENATRHVLLKRKLMGLEDKPLLIPKPRNLNDKPAPVLRSGSLTDAGLSESEIQEIESSLDDWYAASQEPMGVVIARNGVIALAKGYGTLEDKPVTVDTPMLLHSAMKPLIGVQLATYVDRGFLKLDEPIGKHLPDFNTPRDQNLTHRAAHVHATGIHFPWELAFRRLFYFHTWHESLIAHCRREWEPGARHRYGVVGIILSVRSLELLRGMNYWDAMERDIYEPLGIRNILPGGTGFSAENMARIGVLLDNHGRYGEWELFSEDTYQAILPTSLKPYFPAVDMQYGIGLRPSGYLGPGGYGHGGGCGTQLVVNPRTHTVFAMVRNDRGPDYSKHLSKVVSLVRNATIK
jgi:CubicO group peptidase (beta-lactamase class C family)